MIGKYLCMRIKEISTNLNILQNRMKIELNEYLVTIR